jgi:GMP synthase-like glutamine amidotransferase
MSALILKNVYKEGPGTIVDFLRDKKIPFKVVNLEDAECPSAGAAGDYDALVMMGGPMSVHDAEKYPYLKAEEELIRDFVKRGKRVLGVCLGAQLIARALGARVFKGAEPEVGWYHIQPTAEGRADALFSKLIRGQSPHLTVFHWHAETFDIPEGARRLASSELFPNQAFAYGNGVYAFQFHIEVDRRIVYDWMKDAYPDIYSLMAETEGIYPTYLETAEAFYAAFFA